MRTKPVNKSPYKERLLMAGITLITLAISITAIKVFLPQLLGGPADLELVQVDEKVVPFYESVFRQDPNEFQVKDPLTRIRNRPLFPQILRHNVGPHDLLGFRNRAVPNTADIVLIGDSQTYGSNAMLIHTWPSQLQSHLRNTHHAKAYSMATGGWGALQYLQMLPFSLRFHPRTVVVAFYSGNDPMESFMMVYGNKDRWEELVPDKTLKASDAPKSKGWPPKEEDFWKVTFKDGSKAVFTPDSRLLSNMDHPAVSAGWNILAITAAMMDNMASKTGINLFFTVIPTKELAYAKKISEDGIQPDPTYKQLVESEQDNIRKLQEHISQLPASTYIDLVTVLQQNVLTSKSPPLYPDNWDGHPIAGGYQIIAKTVATAIAPTLPQLKDGLYRVTQGKDFKFMVWTNKGSFKYFMGTTNDLASLLDTLDIQEKDIITIDSRTIATLTEAGFFKTSADIGL